MKLKRILSCAVACAMAATVASSLAATASAAGDIVIDVQSITAKAGDTFSVDVSISSIPSSGITALEFAIGYDADVVTITGVKASSNADTGAAAAELALNSSLSSTMVSGSTYSCFDYAILKDQVSASWVTGMEDSKYWLKSKGVVCTIEGKIAADATVKSTNLTVEAIERETYSGSGQKNTAMYAAAVDSSLKVTSYTVDGAVGVITLGGGSTGTAKYGDVLIDGVVDAKDLVKLAKFNAKMVTLTAEEEINADVVHDNVVDTKDLVKLAKFNAKIITEADLAK